MSEMFCFLLKIQSLLINIEKELGNVIYDENLIDRVNFAKFSFCD